MNTTWNRIATAAIVLAAAAVLGVPQASAADTTLPIVTWTAPKHGVTVSGTITLSATASDNVGVTRVEFFYDGLRAGTDTTSPYQVSWSSTKVANGSHALVARAYDAAGNAGRAQITVTVSNSGSTGAKLYWGAWIGGSAYGRAGDAPWDSTTWSLFEQHTVKKASIVHIGQSWQKCTSTGCAYVPFDTGGPNLIRQHGSIPLLDWSSWQMGKGPNQPSFQLIDIINGAHDSFIRSYATAVKNWAKPLFLRFDSEMNLGSQRFAWQENTNGNRTGEYAKMYRHVVDVFNSVGANNVTWVWCPNREYTGSLKPLSGMYPGDAYVDWTCLDGYNWGTNPIGCACGWMSFDTLFASTYDLIAGSIAPSKPMMLGEVGSSEWGGNKATWITDMFAKLPTRYPKIRALVWFNRKDEGMDWHIESSAGAQQAFATGISAPVYLANVFATLSASPIPAP